MSVFLPPRPVGKAVTGPGALAMTYQAPLRSLDATPQKLCLQAQALYHEHPDVNDAERTVSGRASQVPWHLEDGEDVVIDDASQPAYRAARDLLEKPQSALAPKERQGPLQFWRNLCRITLRHMGLCGWSFWYLDQTDALAGIPLAILYLNPSRMYATMSKSGQLLGWSLDKPADEGGTPLESKDVLPFHFDPADNGPYGIGLVESIWRKAQIGQLSDGHIASTLAAGGRLTGVISPKDASSGSLVNDEQWSQFVRDYRNIVENPNAAQRLQIVKGPIDYTRMAATMQELMIPDIAAIGRKAVLAHWGVPESQIGISVPMGLNSGATKSYDEAVLYQGAVHDRLVSFRETVQYGLLDRFTARGITVELEFEEPEFDDDAPAYDKAVKARDLPLTNDERRELVNYPPLEGDLEAFGKMIWLPIGLGEVAGPGFVEPAAPPPFPVIPEAPPATPPPPPVEPAKATLRTAPLAHLRRQVDHSMVPRMKGAVAAVLAGQKADVIARLTRLGLAHLKTRRSDTHAWWTAKSHDRALLEALKPHVGAIAGKVALRTDAILSPVLRPAKASFVDNVTTRVLTRGAGRVSRINQTTERAVQQAIADAIDGAESIQDVISAVEKLAVFDEARSELIARTESMFAYNASALGSYDELGVEMVEPIDGDDDEECQARLARGPVTLAEAEADEDHPNGTLDWAPVLSEPPAKAQVTRFVYDDSNRVTAVIEE